MLNEIIEHFGSQAELARVLDVDRAAVNQWQRSGVPPLRAIQIETLTGGKFKACEIVQKGEGNGSDV